MLADPAETCIARQRLFQDRSTVDERPMTEGSDHLLQPLGKPLETRSQHPVVVASEGIAGNVAVQRIRERGLGISGFARPVVHSDDDDADSARDDLGRFGASCPPARHITHLAVPSEGEPAQQMAFIVCEFERRDADAREAELETPAADVRK